MTKPSVEPTSVCLKAQAGTILSSAVTIAKAPIAASVTAFIANGNATIALKHVIATELVKVPFTDEEIEQLPRLPPSIRENARKNGTTEQEEVGRSDGRTPLAVPFGSTVQFEVVFSAPQQDVPDITTATLIIEGTTWERVEIPLLFLTGEGASLHTFEPGSIRRFAAPGDSSTDTFGIANIWSTAKVVACVKGRNDVIQVKELIAFHPVRRDFTEDEINQMSPLPPTIRQAARRNGYIEYQEVAKSDGHTALTVPAGTRFTISVEISVPPRESSEAINATITVHGTTWQSVELPISLIIGKLSMAVSPDSLTVRQGESGDLQLQISSLAPSTDVECALGQAGSEWRIDPPSIHVPRGGNISTVLKAFVAGGAPLGTYPLGLQLTSFEGRHFQQLPFTLTVQSGEVTVRLLQLSLVATQGDRVTCDMEVISRGGFKRIDIGPSTLPGGIGMNASGAVLGPEGERRIIRLDFLVDSQALPIVDAYGSLNWSSNGGEHRGRLDLSFTILLRPDTREFNQSIVTGTALGGNAELILHNDGNATFKGFMRATGALSFQFRVRAIVTSRSGRIAVVAQKSGEVFGSVDPGPRRFDWNEPSRSLYTGPQWADIRDGAMTVSRSSEMTGSLGTILEVAVDLVEFLAVNVIFGTVSAIIFAGSELAGLAGVDIAGPFGLSGLVVAGGVLFLFGPGIGIPVLVEGAILGNVLVESRALFPNEIKFAESVFGEGTLPVDRILLTNLSGEDGRAFTVPSLGKQILVNIGSGGFADPLSMQSNLYPVAGQVFIHELVHAWQIARSSFAPELFWQAAADKFKGEAAYSYGPPGPPWSKFGLEAQASIVDDWFAGTKTNAQPSAQDAIKDRRGPMDPNDPYFAYILDNIMLAVA